MKELTPILAFFSFWTGACIASFLNVVIWRVPRGESIVSPPSHCPKCNAAIRWYQNIPILSWLALRGRCANCKAPISPRYILIETLGGCLFLAAFLKVVFTTCTPADLRALVLPPETLVTTLVWWIWIALMIVGSMIDFDHKLLPDFVTVGGMVLGVAASVLVFFVFHFGADATSASLPVADATSASLPYSDIQTFSNQTSCTSLVPHPLSSLLGLAFGFGLLWLIRWFGSKAFKREAMGMGDVFLMGAIGALFGPVAVLVSLILSSVIGSIAGVTMILLSRRSGRFVEIPYGPYICLGCLAWMFYGPQLVSLYVNLFKFN